MKWCVFSEKQLTDEWRWWNVLKSELLPARGLLVRSDLRAVSCVLAHACLLVWNQQPWVSDRQRKMWATWRKRERAGESRREQKSVPFLSWLSCLLLDRHRVASLINEMGSETWCTWLNLISAACLFTVTGHLLSVTNASCGPGECHYGGRIVI